MGSQFFLRLLVKAQENGICYGKGSQELVLNKFLSLNIYSHLVCIKKKKKKTCTRDSILLSPPSSLLKTKICWKHLNSSYLTKHFTYIFSFVPHGKWWHLYSVVRPISNNSCMPAFSFDAHSNMRTLNSSLEDIESWCYSSPSLQEGSNITHYRTVWNNSNNPV